MPEDYSLLLCQFSTSTEALGWSGLWNSHRAFSALGNPSAFLNPIAAVQGSDPSSLVGLTCQSCDSEQAEQRHAKHHGRRSKQVGTQRLEASSYQLSSTSRSRLFKGGRGDTRQSQAEERGKSFASEVDPKGTGRRIPEMASKTLP